MKYSNKLALNEFFFNVCNQHYVIIKNQYFPNYFSGSDIDIICDNKKDFMESILEIGNGYLEKGFEIDIKETSPTHLYIDFNLNETIEFRFDINELSLPFKKVHLDIDFYYSLLLNKITIPQKWNKQEYTIFVPSPEDELILRYIEYTEYFSSRPDKIKHLDFILKKLNTNENKQVFLDKLHKHIKYIDIIDEETPSPTFSGKNMYIKARTFVKKLFHKINQMIHKDK